MKTPREIRVHASIRAVLGTAVVLLVCAVAAAATSPLSMMHTKNGAGKGIKDATTGKGAQASYYFFHRSEKDFYGLNLDSRMRRKLIVLQTHRRINPCGVVDPVTIVAADPSFHHYGVEEELTHCSLDFAGEQPTTATIKISQIAPTMREIDRFSVDSVAVVQHAPETPGTCFFVVNLGIASLRYAPQRMADFQAHITTVEDAGEHPCQRGKVVSMAAARHVARKGPPQWSSAEAVTKIALADPCMPARVVPGIVGLSSLDTGSHWCGFLMSPDQDSPSTLVKLYVQLRPITYLQQITDGWGIHDTQKTSKGDTVVVVYEGMFDEATGTYHTPAEKLHCAVYVITRDQVHQKSVDGSPLESADTRYPVVEIHGEHASCSTNQEIASGWLTQFE